MAYNGKVTGVSPTNDHSSRYAGKRIAARTAVDENFSKDCTIVGVGSGTTILYAIERLAELENEFAIKPFYVPTGYQSKQALIDRGLRVIDLEAADHIDVAFDGADEVDANLTCIKGGGGCHLQEMLVARCANKFVIIADIKKKSECLGQKWHRGLPIEVVPSARKFVSQEIVRKFNGSGNVHLRIASCKAGPVITDNGNFILDWIFDNNFNNWNKIYTEIKLISGVVEVGVFVDLVDSVYFGDDQENVSRLHKKFVRLKILFENHMATQNINELYEGQNIAQKATNVSKHTTANHNGDSSTGVLTPPTISVIINIDTCTLEMFMAKRTPKVNGRTRTLVNSASGKNIPKCPLTPAIKKFAKYALKLPTLTAQVTPHTQHINLVPQTNPYPMFQTHRPQQRIKVG
ncbi:hypothetical protein GJ496_009565 [Pomphorhynchus laevis]|nr:hypothetical protein GJ496_009565 [Pomphorhynchus laevis]